MKGLGVRTFKNVFWSGFGQFGSFGLRYVTFLVLAWVLSPADIGLESLATVVILLAGDFGRMGFESVLIQRRNIDAEHYSTAFWASLIFSLVIAGVISSFAREIAVLLGDPRSAPLIKALSITIPFQAATIIPGSRLSKKMRFRAWALIQFVEQIIYGLTALTLAFTGAGVWSLVWGRVIMMAVRVGLMWGFEPWRPSLIFEWKIFKEMISFGFQTLTSNVLTRGLDRVDYFLVGRFLGTQELGYYTLAAQLAVVPAQRLVGAVQRVAFPALTLVQNNIKRIRSGLLQIFKYLLVLMIPYSVFLLVFSLPLIETLYDHSWLPAVPLMQIMGLTGLITAVDAARAAFFARGRPDLWMWVILSRLLIFSALALLMGLDGGAQGVAVTMTLAIGVTGLISMILAGRLVGMNIKMIVEHIWRPMVGGGAALSVWLISELFVVDGVPQVLKLTMIGPVLAVVYFSFTFTEIREIVNKLFSIMSEPAVPLGIEQGERDA